MPHLTNRLTATVVDILDFAPFSCVPLSFATDRRLLRLFRRHLLPHRSSNHAAVMFIKTGNSRNAARVAILPACCYRTRIFIAGEMSRSDRALDDARCSADRRSSELDGNVNERARSWLLPIFTSPKILPPPPSAFRSILPNSNLVEFRPTIEPKNTEHEMSWQYEEIRQPGYPREMEKERGNELV